MDNRKNIEVKPRDEKMQTQNYPMRMKLIHLRRIYLQDIIRKEDRDGKYI